MVECPKCGSYAVEAYLYKVDEKVCYGNHCLDCGLKSSDLGENSE